MIISRTTHVAIKNIARGEGKRELQFEILIWNIISKKLKKTLIRLPDPTNTQR